MEVEQGGGQLEPVWQIAEFIITLAVIRPSGFNQLRSHCRATIHAHLMRVALTKLGPQSLGIYLQENQPWEFALIQLWKKLNHNTLVGFPHSSVRYWDLRHYFYPSVYEIGKSYELPRPTMVGCSSEDILDAYQSTGYPISELRQVELSVIYILRQSSQEK